MKDCAVYLVAGLEAVKIGHAANPAQRRTELAVGCSEPIFLRHAWRASRADAQALERRLHNAFSWCRLRGEWFAIDWNIVKQVGDMMVRGDGDLASGILADLSEWRGLRTKDFDASIGALKRAYAKGLRPVNEWDDVFLD